MLTDAGILKAAKEQHVHAQPPRIELQPPALSSRALLPQSLNLCRLIRAHSKRGYQESFASMFMCFSKNDDYGLVHGVPVFHL